MSARVPWPPSGFDDLSPEEKIEYVQSLWDRIASVDEWVPIPEWHRTIIRERLADPDTDSPDWHQVRDQIARDLHQSRPNS